MKKLDEDTLIILIGGATVLAVAIVCLQIGWLWNRANYGDGSCLFKKCVVVKEANDIQAN